MTPPTTLDAEQIVRLLARGVRDYGLRGYARMLKVSPTFLHAVLTRKSPPSDTLTRAIGYRRVINYRRESR